MKKILAVLIAVLMCLTMTAISEAAVNAIEVAQDDTYAEVNLGDGRAITRIPADWRAIEAEYSDDSGKLLGAYANADGTAMVIITETKIGEASDAAALCAEAAEAGLECELNAYNANTFAEFTAVGEDGYIVRMANYFVDANTIVALTFSCEDGAQEAMQPMIHQALAGLAVK